VGSISISVQLRGHRRQALTTSLSPEITRSIRDRRTISGYPQQRRQQPSTCPPPGATGIRRRTHPKRGPPSTARQAQLRDNISTQFYQAVPPLYNLQHCSALGYRPRGTIHILTGATPRHIPDYLTQEPPHKNKVHRRLTPTTTSHPNESPRFKPSQTNSDKDHYETALNATTATGPSHPLLRSTVSLQLKFETRLREGRNLPAIGGRHSHHFSARKIPNRRSYHP
jgi:hypothetical protein